MAFKNYRELMEAFLRGDKIKHFHWDPPNFIWLDQNGCLIDNKGDVNRIDFNSPSDWSIWTPPKVKKIKTIELYQWLIQYSPSREYVISQHSSEPPDMSFVKHKLIKRLDETKKVVQVEEGE